jgi:hypothetical protein
MPLRGGWGHSGRRHLGHQGEETIQQGSAEEEARRGEDEETPEAGPSSVRPPKFTDLEYSDTEIYFNKAHRCQVKKSLY